MTRRGLLAAIALVFAATMPEPLRGEEAGTTTLADVAQASQMANLSDGTGLFGSIEVASASFQGLPQWTRVMAVM
ncbi:MAG TPA: hypothetical protein VGA50_11665, partial [Kiloniellales bacterium]